MVQYIWARSEGIRLLQLGREERRMKCEQCGKELLSLEVDMFNADGSDDWYTVEDFFHDEETGMVAISVLTNWTGDELDEDELADTIRCPHCKQYPFKCRLIETCRYVSIQMYPSKRKEE